MLSLGHTHPIVREGGIETSLGVRGSAGMIDADLESRYGTRFPLGVMAFVQVAPHVLRDRDASAAPLARTFAP